MNSNNNTFNDKDKSKKWSEVYNDINKIIEFRFANKTDQNKYIWIEPAAISIELVMKSEYKILTHEKSFSIEYDSDSQFTLWMNNTFGFKLYKKVMALDNTEEWILDIDLSNIQLEE